MSRARDPALWGAVALVAAFGAGMGVGELLLDGEDTDASPPPSAALFDGLDLTADQQTAVDSILTDLRFRTDSVIDATREPLTRAAREAQDGIEAVLSPEQAALVRERMRQLQGTSDR